MRKNDTQMKKSELLPFHIINSKYKKTIWQCVKSTKNGKRFCPDSKGIPEQVIEEAFIESYRMLCKDNRDVLDI